jgi:hypothetical protein
VGKGYKGRFSLSFFIGLNFIHATNIMTAQFTLFGLACSAVGGIPSESSIRSFLLFLTTLRNIVISYANISVVLLPFILNYSIILTV